MLLAAALPEMGVFAAIFLTGRIAPKRYGGAADLSLYCHFVALGWVPL